MKQLKMNKFARAAVYIRVSTKKQAEMFGLTYQERVAKSLIAKNMWSFVKVYEDRGISGTCGPDKRIGLQYLLEDAYNNIFDKVVIFSVDRLGRTHEIVNNIYDELVKNNVEIISCTENTNDKDKIDELINQAYVELKIIKNRQMLGMRERVKLDGDSGGRLPYGYRRIDGKLAVNSHDSNIINCIYESYYVTKISVCKITEILNKEKIKSPKGVIWYRSTVHNIINNQEKYTGCYRNGSDTRWPVILINKYP